MSADLAAVSIQKILLEPVPDEVQLYYDILVVDINKEHLTKNKDVKGFHHIMHSRNQSPMFFWTAIVTDDQKAHWNMLLRTFLQFDNIGHIFIPKLSFYTPPVRVA